MLNNETSTCSKCSNAGPRLSSKIKTELRFGHLFKFFLIVLPSFIIAGVGVYNFSIDCLIIWLALIGLFYSITEVRVLRSGNLYYGKSSVILCCWTNCATPKLLKYCLGKKNKIEKSILISGFAIVWVYPLVFIYLQHNGIFLLVYLVSVGLFLILLRINNCKKCLDFSCSLHKANNFIRDDFFNKRFLN